MKQEINPAIFIVVIAVVLVVAGMLVWKNVGPRNDGPAQPISMAEKMGAGKMAPPQRGGGVNMGASKQP